MAKKTGTYRSKTTEVDELKSFAEKAKGYVQEKPREIAMVAAVLAALVIAVLSVAYLADRADRKRIIAVTDVISRYNAAAGDGGDMTAIREELEEVSRTYASSELGGQALYFLGGALGREGKHEEAADVYLEVHRKFEANRTLADAALLGAAYSYAAAGSGDKALEHFRSLLSLESEAVPRGQIRLEVARILRSQGDADGAAEELRLLIEEYPDSTHAGEARKLLDLVEGS